MAGEIDHMLAGAAAGLDHVAGFAGEKSLQHRPDRLMVAVKRRRIETAVGLDRPAILAEFHDILSHDISQLAPSTRFNDADRYTGNAIEHSAFSDCANITASDASALSADGVYAFDRLYSGR